MIFYLSAVLALTAIGGYSGGRALLFLVPVTLAAIVCGHKSRAWFIRIFLLLLPLGGLINLIVGVRGLPPLLLIFYSGLLGSVLRSPQPFQYPRPVFIYIGSTLFSFLVAVLRFAPWGLPAKIVVSTPWAQLSLANAMAWILLALLTTLAGPILFGALESEFKGEKSRLRLLALVGMSFVLPSVVGLLQYTRVSSFGLNTLFLRGGLPQYNATFIDPNALGIICALLIPLFLGCLVEKQFSFRWVLPVLALVFLLLISGCRSAIVAATVALMIFFAVLMVRKPRAAIVILFCVAMSVTVYRWDQTHRFKDSSRLNRNIDQVIALSKGEAKLNTLLGDRRALWRAGFVTFKHLPIIGTGLGAYLLRMPDYRSEIGEVYNDNAGNQYLQIAAEQGLLGLAVFLFLIGSFVVEFLSFHRSDWISIGAFSALVGLAVAFIFGSHLNNFETAMFFWMTLAALAPRPG